MALDLVNLKTTIAGIFNTANDTGASYDLSTSMETRVQKILTVNPIKIPVQPSLYPYVTVWCIDKQIQGRSMAGSQSAAKRQATINLRIAGVIWNSRIPDPTKDRADDECEYLMENIEEILRRNETLGGTVLWNMPEVVTYHNIRIDEETNLRSGLMSLKAQVLY